MSSKRRIGFSPATEDTVALFARVPASAGKKLSRTALELGRPKQEVIAALVDRYAGILGEEFSLGRASGAADPPEVLTPDELAALLQIDVEAVLDLATKGELPGRKLQTEWRFSRNAVLAWLAGPQPAATDSAR
jgi:excisionase family DNA binding protein